jgi:hypothetical protein
MTKYVFLHVSLLVFVTSAAFSQLPVKAVNQPSAPQKAYFNLINNSDVDLQYYGCDGANNILLSDETGGGVNSGLYNQFGEYMQTLTPKAKTTNLSIQQGYDPALNGFAPLPTNLTIKVALGIPKVAESLDKICTSANTTYIKSISVPVNLVAATDITIAGSGNTTTSLKGFVNGTYVGNQFDFTQELNNPLQNTTPQPPRIIFASSGPATAGAKVCKDGSPVSVNISSNNQYYLDIPAGSDATFSPINNDGTSCQTVFQALAITNPQTDYLYNTSVYALIPPVAAYQSSNYSVTSTTYTPSQKGVYIQSATAGTPTTYTKLAQACVDNVVVNEVVSTSGYIPVGTGSHSILPVNNANACDTTKKPYVINTPANTYSSLTLMNVHDSSVPLNVSLSVPTSQPVQQPTIQTPVSMSLPTSGTTSSVDNKVSTTLLLERDLAGNLSMKEANSGTAGEDLLSVQFEFTGTTTLPAGTTVTYTPITDKANLTSGGQGLPDSGQLTVPFEIALSPKPANPVNMTVSFNTGSLLRLQPNKLLLKAFASNSPFVSYPASASGNLITTTIPGGFKQLALYEVNPTTTSGLIRTGGDWVSKNYLISIIVLAASVGLVLKLKLLYK